MRDIFLGDTRDFKFTTRQFSDGVPTTAVGLVISAYPDNSTTQITAGITTTFTSGFDGVAGLVNVRVVATGGNGYLDDTDYSLVVTAGTVGGVSIVGEVVGDFSIQRAPVNWANVSNPTTALDLSATDIQLADTVTTLTNLPAITANWLTAAGISASALDGKGDWALASALTTAQNDLDTITDSDGVILGAAGVDLIWDEVLSGGTHNVANSAGKRLRQIDAGFEVHSGTADAGTSTTIDFETGVASTTDDIYNGDRVVITGGTGAGEHGLVLDYVGSTQQATMSKAWVITPDATSEYIVLPADCDVELWNDNAVTGDGDWAELQTDVDAILLDTGTTLDSKIDTIDTIVDAIKAKTDSLTFTQAGHVDSNIQRINDVAITGDGSATPFDV